MVLIGFGSYFYWDNGASNGYPHPPEPFSMVYEETWDWEGVAADQGLALSDDGQYLFCTATHFLRKIRLSDHAVLAEVITDEPNAQHTGDGCYHSGYVYVPVTSWTSTVVDYRYIKIYDANLKLIHKFLLKKSDWQGEAASIDYDDTTGLFWIGDFNTPYVHCYDINPIAGTCEYIESKFIGLYKVQGITWLNGKLYLLQGDSRSIFQFVDWVKQGSVFVGGYEGLEALGERIYIGERHFGGSPVAPVRVYQITSGL